MLGHPAPPPAPHDLPIQHVARTPYVESVPSHDVPAVRDQHQRERRFASLAGPPPPMQLPHLQAHLPLDIYGKPSPLGRLSVADQVQSAQQMHMPLPPSLQKSGQQFVKDAPKNETLDRALPLAAAGLPLQSAGGAILRALQGLNTADRTGVIAGFPNNSVLNAASKKQIASAYHLPPNPSDADALRALLNPHSSYWSDVGHNLFTGALKAPLGLAAGTYASGKAIVDAAQGNTKPAQEIFKGTMDYVSNPKENFRRDPLTYLLAGHGGLKAGGALAGRAMGLEGGIQTITPRNLAAEVVGQGGDVSEVTRPIEIGRYSKNALNYGAQRLKGRLAEGNQKLSDRLVGKASGQVTRLTDTERDVAIRNLVKPVLDKMHRASKDEQKAALAAHGQNVTPGELKTFYEGRVPQIEETIRTTQDATHRAAAVRELRAVKGAAKDWARIEQKVGNTPSPAMSGLLDSYRGAVRKNEAQLQAEGLLDPLTAMQREELPRDVVASGSTSGGQATYFPHRQPPSAKAALQRMRLGSTTGNRVYGHRFDENTGTLLRQGRTDITPRPALKALAEPNQALYAARHLADQRARFAIPGEKDMLYDPQRLTAIKKDTTPDAPSASAQQIVTHGLLDNPEIRGGQAILPDGYDLIPKQIADNLRGRFASTEQRSGLSRAGQQATNAFRWWALTARPAWLASNIAGNTIQAAVAGAGPTSFYRALNKERSLHLPGTSKTLDFRLPGKDYGGVVPLNAEWQGFITRQLQPSRGILPGTGRRNPFDVIRDTNVSNENWARRAVYLRHALPEYGKNIDDLMQAKTAEERLPHVTKIVDRFLGNFSHHGITRDLAMAVPFVRWLTFITKLTLKDLPLHHPGRATLLHLVGNLGNAAVAQEGIVNQSLQGSIPVGGRDVRTQAWNPFATVPQLAGFDPTSKYDQPTFSGVLGSLNPFLQAGYTTLSGHEFQSPSFAPLASNNLEGRAALGANQLASMIPAFSLAFGRPTFGAKATGQSRMSLAFPQPTPSLLDRLIGYNLIGETPVNRRNMALKNFMLLEQNAKAKGGIR